MVMEYANQKDLKVYISEKIQKLFFNFFLFLNFVFIINLLSIIFLETKNQDWIHKNLNNWLNHYYLEFIMHIVIKTIF